MAVDVSLPTRYTSEDIRQLQQRLAKELIELILNDQKFEENPEAAAREKGVLEKLAVINSLYHNVATPEGLEDEIAETVDSAAAPGGGCSGPSSCCCVTGIY